MEKSTEQRRTVDEDRTELTVPSDLRMLPLVHAYVDQVARLGGLQDDEGAALVLAAELACAEVIRHGFEPGERAPLRLVAKLNGARVTLTIHERGFPFEPDTERAAPLPAAVDPTHTLSRGPRWEQIRQAVDGARWTNRGAEGMELRLVKERRGTGVTELLPAAALAAHSFDAPLAPEQTYTIRRMGPAEAVQVARCVYRTYGYTYFTDAVYYPDRLVHLNATGELVSIVALDEAGDIVGHYALKRPELGRVADAAQALVAPAHRHRGLLERLQACLEETAQELKLDGIYCEAVTVHTFTQQAEEAFGHHVCGVILGLVPAAVTYKHLAAAEAGDRVSAVLYYKRLRAYPAPIVHVPPHHQQMVEAIYRQLAQPVTLGTPARPHGHGALGVHYARRPRSGTIRVERVGDASAAEVARARRDLVELAGCEVIFLELPLDQPGTAALCTAVEQDGFFFSGIGPCFTAEGDVLRLQYLTVPLDTTRLQILHPFAREILTYVESERQRVTAPNLSPDGAPAYHHHRRDLR